jgi:uncharacterized membrane protein YtjA (UPF0391 family)
MMPWWIVFVVIALVAAAYGFVGPADGQAGIAQVYLFGFIGIFALYVVAKIRGRRRFSRIPVSREP